MADISTSTDTSYNIVLDPFYALAQEVEATKTKVADSVFEGYKLSVAQTNDINNRAMQVALHDTGALSDLKAAVSAGTLQTMLAASRTDAAISATAMSTQREILVDGSRTRDLVNGLNTQNLNTALINTNTALVGGGVSYAGLGVGYGQLGTAFNSAVQSADIASAVNAFGSQVASQGVVNTGVMTGTVQTNTGTNIG